MVIDNTIRSADIAKIEHELIALEKNVNITKEKVDKLAHLQEKNTKVAYR